jgi:threonine/homoserine/homoserine lactone efflux protein
MARDPCRRLRICRRVRQLPLPEASFVRHHAPVIGHFLAFLAVSLLVIVTPGPDTALTIRNSLLRGRRGGVVTAAGVAAGQSVWACCTAAGVASLVRASQPALLALRVAGASYLVYLGVRALLDSRAGASEPARHSERRAGMFGPFGQGLISNLSNPKMLVFFISLLPQFAGSGSFFALFGLGLAFCTLTFVWLSGYAAVVARVGDFLRRGRIRRAVDRISGAILIALGVRLASDHV